MKHNWPDGIGHGPGLDISLKQLTGEQPQSEKKYLKRNWRLATPVGGGKETPDVSREREHPLCGPHPTD